MENERDRIWNQRYQTNDYVYGETPNQFFAEQIQILKPGNLILPCEGEGRNAVYAASLGWHVQAFDGSEIGKNKAMQLASYHQVSFDYIISDAASVLYEENSVDLIAFIFAHFSADVRIKVHQRAIKWLRPGGKIILEAFNLNQISNNSGGPRDKSMLYTTDMLTKDFAEMKVNSMQTVQTTLQEGSLHVGLADLIQFVGTK